MQLYNWTTKNIPDLTGKTIIVTGGNSGLGLESVKAFAGRNAYVIMACRSVDKGRVARKQILEIFPAGKIEVMELDLADMNSIKAFAEKYSLKHKYLDVLLNNAGVMMIPYSKTNDGFEKQFGTNHLGHFALTGLLLEQLKNTPKSRVVTVSSMAHKRGVMDFSNLMFENGKGYNPMKAYGRSKLANLLFAFELQRFFEKNNIDCLSVAAHPGVSDTNLAMHLVNKWVYKILLPLFSFMIQPADMGALPQIRAAVDSNAKGGQYFGPDGKREMKGYPVHVQPNKTAQDKDIARKLWQISEQLTAVVFK
jgi:NAD(P)-dependent dehydrogenase (short-subunit alcohol dehydrogenase family)